MKFFKRKERTTDAPPQPSAEEIIEYASKKQTEVDDSFDKLFGLISETLVALSEPKLLTDETTSGPSGQSITRGLPKVRGKTKR